MVSFPGLPVLLDALECTIGTGSIFNRFDRYKIKINKEIKHFQLKKIPVYKQPIIFYINTSISLLYVDIKTSAHKTLPFLCQLLNLNNLLFSSY